MKYWRGFMVAAAIAALTIALTSFAAAHEALIDMIYPYASRLVLDVLAEWSAQAPFCLWQMLAIVLVVLLLTSIVIMIILRWNFIQWLSWTLAGVCLLWCLHTGLYGLNQYSGPLAEDIRLTIQPDITTTDLVNATTYFRDQANALSDQVPRTADGQIDSPSFAEVAAQAGDGFHTLVYQKNYSVFAGTTTPVKELGWADMYTSMGITGVTMPLTGEAAVNPQTPTISLPFTICHEMAHRMSIAQERDANLAAFLATTNNSDLVYQYSGYFMAYRYCYNALVSLSTSTATNAAVLISEGINDNLRADLDRYHAYYASVQDSDATDFANNVNNTYLQASGDESGIKSYGEVTDLLICWYLQDIYLPAHADEEVEDKFNPFDKEDVFRPELEEGA